MSRDSKSTILTLTILLGLFLQVIFAFADSQQSPQSVAVRFAKAFYRLDPAMSRMLCSQLKSEGNIVKAYLDKTEQEAKMRGFKSSMLRSALYDLQTETVADSDQSATVHIKGERRVEINPVFVWVARIFNIGEAREFEQTLQLVKEKGHWRVCSASLFTMEG